MQLNLSIRPLPTALLMPFLHVPRKKEARPLGSGPIVPADGRYLFYQNVATCDGFIVKGKKFSLETLVGSSAVASAYAEGSMAIARLCPSDYHRFHFPVDCKPGVARLINGPLFSAEPYCSQTKYCLVI